MPSDVLKRAVECDSLVQSTADSMNDRQIFNVHSEVKHVAEKQTRMKKRN